MFAGDNPLEADSEGNMNRIVLSLTHALQKFMPKINSKNTKALMFGNN